MTYTADICDALPRDVRVLDPIFKDYGGVTMFEGEVVTVRFLADNGKLKEVLAEQGNGRVLVVDAGGWVKRSALGGILAEQAHQNGWAGLVVHGAVRDTHELCEVPIGIKAMTTFPLKTEKSGLGERDVTVTFAGQTIHCGDYLYADLDGIVVLEKPFI